MKARIQKKIKAILGQGKKISRENLPLILATLLTAAYPFFTQIPSSAGAEQLPAGNRINGAKIILRPTKGLVEKNQEIALKVHIDSGGQKVSLAKVRISYLGNIIPSDIVKDSPLCQNDLKASQTTESNSLGFGCNFASPIIVNSQVATVYFRAIGTGTANFRLEGSETFLDPPVSELKLKHGQDESISLLIFDPKEKSAPGSFVLSPSHPEEKVWYKENEVKLEWLSAGNPKEFEYLFSQSPSAPENYQKTDKTSLKMEIGDGTWYFHIKPDNGAAASVFRLNIDSKAPEMKPAIQGGQVKLNATDSHSGIKRSWVIVDGHKTYLENDLYDIPTELRSAKNIEAGTEDLAGNVLTVSFTIPPSKK